MRFRSSAILVLAAAAAAGALGTPATGSGFVRVFCFVFWAVVVGGVLFLARRSSAAAEEITPDELVRDPWVDEIGVRRFPQDVMDVENHPLPGAHGRL